MATSFTGWGSSWGGSWGLIAQNPNAMVGAAGFTLTAIASATATAEVSGAASLTFSALGVLVSELELPTQTYYGSGQTSRAPAPDYTEADIERLVTEKWEAIEKAQRKKPAPSPKPLAKPSPRPSAKVEPAPIVTPLVIEINTPLVPVASALTAIEPIATNPGDDTQAKAEKRAKRERQELAFLLMLGAL
jgi:hypothetical protein